MRLKPLALALLVLFLRPLPAARAEEVISVGTFAELAAFSEAVARGERADARVILTADISATGPMRAIGTALHMFSGVFDGQDHVISDLRVFGPWGSQGLFGSVAPEGVVKNLVLRRACVLGAGFVGGVAGYSAGRIENCRVTDSRLICLSPAPCGAVGGIAGLASGRITGCAALRTSARGSGNAGGLAGAFHAGVMERCAFWGSVACADRAACGGLAGSLHGGARMTRCAGCGRAAADPRGAAGGVFSGSSAAGSSFGKPERLRGLRRLLAALAGVDPEELAEDTNFQHFPP